MRIQLKCGSEDRRQAVKNSVHLNGIDYLEVLAPANINEKPLLIVRFFKPVAGLTKDNLVIDGRV
jgi:hypothetical protein